MSFRPLAAGPSRTTAVAIQTPLRTARRTLIMPHPDLKKGDPGDTDRFRLLLPSRDKFDMIDVFTYLRAAEKALGTTIIAVDAARDVDSCTILPFVRVMTLRPIPFKGSMTVRVKAREEEFDIYGGPSLDAVMKAIKTKPETLKEGEVGRDFEITRDPRQGPLRAHDGNDDQFTRIRKRKEAGSFERVLDALDSAGGEWAAIAQKYNHLRRPDPLLMKRSLKNALRNSSPFERQSGDGASRLSSESFSESDDRLSSAIRRRADDEPISSENGYGDAAAGQWEGRSEEGSQDVSDAMSRRRNRENFNRELRNKQRRERAIEYEKYEQLASKIIFKETPEDKTKSKRSAKKEKVSAEEAEMRFKIPVRTAAEKTKSLADDDADKAPKVSITPEQARRLVQEKKEALASARNGHPLSPISREPRGLLADLETDVHIDVVDPADEPQIPLEELSLKDRLQRELGEKARRDDDAEEKAAMEPENDVAAGEPIDGSDVVEPLKEPPTVEMPSRQEAPEEAPKEEEPRPEPRQKSKSGAFGKWFGF